jgi:hypothetical protein
MPPSTRAVASSLRFCQTHQDALGLVGECLGHVIAEHSTPKPTGGVGIIVVLFRELDRDFCLELSGARTKNSSLGEWEPGIREAHGEHARQRASVRDFAPPVTIRRKIRNVVAFYLIKVRLGRGSTGTTLALKSDHRQQLMNLSDGSCSHWEPGLPSLRVP